MASLWSRSHLRSRHIVRQVAAWSRAYHLDANKATQLLPLTTGQSTNDDLPTSTSLSPRHSFLIFASRALHRPAIRAKPVDASTSSSALLPLDIFAPKVDQDALDAWLLGLGYKNDHLETLSNVVQGMWECWVKNDLLRLEVSVGTDGNGNPFTTRPSAVGDDFALYRQPNMKAFADEEEMHPLERQAAKAGLFYKKKTGGNIGCYGYGAGVAMSTMDALVVAGGKPANFLDGGGGATDANVEAAMSVLLADSDVKTIFINSFGGLTKTDLIAKGVVRVLRQRVESGEKIPEVVVRLRGTGEAEAKTILEAATDLEKVYPVRDMREAAAAAVKSAGG